MPCAICDTSPLQYLHQVGLLKLLPALFHPILVPPAVAREIETGLGRGVSLPLIPTLPWVNVVSSPLDPAAGLSAGLGRGEREVLSLAVGMPNCDLLIDDALARRWAARLNFHTVGTLGILLRAKERRLIERVLPVMVDLDRLGFRLHPTTRQAVLHLAGELPLDAS